MLFTLSVTTSLGDAISLVRKAHHCGLLGGCYIPEHFHSHIHLRKRYSLASLSYSLYVPFYSTFITVL
jgi:REP element-mobilizing transposase RayT